MTKGYLLENCWHELSESRYELDLSTILVLSFFLFVGIECSTYSMYFGNN